MGSVMFASILDEAIPEQIPWKEDLWAHTKDFVDMLESYCLTLLFII